VTGLLTNYVVGITDVPNSWSNPEVKEAKLGSIVVPQRVFVAGNTDIINRNFPSFKLRDFRVLERNGLWIGAKEMITWSNILLGGQILECFGLLPAPFVSVDQIGEGRFYERDIFVSRLGTMMGKHADIHYSRKRRGLTNVFDKQIGLYRRIGYWSWRQELRSALFDDEIWSLINFKRFLGGLESGISGSCRAPSSISGDDGLVGGSLSFPPLQAGIIGVLNEENRCCSTQEKSSPLKRREGKYLEFLAFIYFVVGLWFIYTAFNVERKPIVSISKILFGVIILALGWATEQAALNLIDFGYIDWSHLL
jgi:hypothetical protein